MKKRFILFSAIVGGAFFFQGCANCDEVVSKAKTDAETACATQLEELNTQLAAANDMVTLITGERDSLQGVIDSLTAPKGTAKKPVATKKPAPAPTPKDPQKERAGGSTPVETQKERAGGSGTSPVDAQKKRN